MRFVAHVVMHYIARYGGAVPGNADGVISGLVHPGAPHAQRVHLFPLLDNGALKLPLGEAQPGIPAVTLVSPPALGDQALSRRLRIG